MLGKSNWAHGVEQRRLRWERVLSGLSWSPYMEGGQTVSKATVSWRVAGVAVGGQEELEMALWYLPQEPALLHQL